MTKQEIKKLFDEVLEFPKVSNHSITMNYDSSTGVYISIHHSERCSCCGGSKNSCELKMMNKYEPLKAFIDECKNFFEEENENDRGNY